MPYITYTSLHISTCGVRIKNEIGTFLGNDIINAFFYKPFRNFNAQYKVLKANFLRKKDVKKILSIVIAIFFAVVLFIVAINILATVDETLAWGLRFVTGYFTYSFDIYYGLIWAIPVSAYLFAMFYSSVNRHNAVPKTEQSILAQRKKLNPPVIIFTLSMTSLLLVYIIFFISHAITLTTAFAEGGVVYSNYARQGFFEICQISFLSLVICLSASACYKTDKTIKVLNTLIASFTLLIMSTAVVKLGLYIHFYGLSPKRIYAAWALLIIGVALILLVVRQFKLYNFIKVVSLFTVISFILISLCGVEQFATRYNFTRYQSGTLEDFDYTGYIADYPYYSATYAIDILQNSTDKKEKAHISTSLLSILDRDVQLQEFSMHKLAAANLENHIVQTKLAPLTDYLRENIN